MTYNRGTGRQPARLAIQAAALFAAGSMLVPAVHAQSRSAHEAVEHGAKVSKPLFGDTNPAAKLFNDSGSGTSASTSSSSSSEMGRRGGMSGQLSRAEVTELQRALNRNGAGLRVDGAMGPRTREALMSYQSRNELPVSGHLDSDTRMKLDM